MDQSIKPHYVPKKYHAHNSTSERTSDQKVKYSYRNIMSLKRLIFPPISKDKMNNLMIDDESIKYITFSSSAQEITGLIMNNLNDFPCPSNQELDKWMPLSPIKRMNQLVITEMTAGVGGNVLNFAKYFKYVNAIEIDTTRYNYLHRNVKLYDHENVNCYNADSIKMLIEGDDIVQDIVFFDPPWGGKDYKLFTNLKLNFGQYTIEEVCCRLLAREQTKMIVMKLPNNYDFDHLRNALNNFNISKYNLDRMTIVIVKNYLPGV
jgi:16S rRNA G966 N2-methylase RsmD